MSAIHHNEFTEQFYKVVPKGQYLRDNKIPYSEDKTEREYTLYNTKHTKLVSFRARALPGCCGVLVVYYLRPNNLKAGLLETAEEKQLRVFEETLELIRIAAGKAKFGTLLLTQTESSIGGKTGYTPVASFVNWKTKNKVLVYQVETPEPPVEAKKGKFEGE